LIFNAIVTTLFTPVAGRLIDRFGERRILALNYACLIPLFASYALVHNVAVLGVLYCVDNAFFSFGLGINSYLGRIATSKDLTPSLVMGTTMNHVAAVGVPVVGGLLWDHVGYQVTFLAGAATCVLSVATALAIRADRFGQTDTTTDRTTIEDELEFGVPILPATPEPAAPRRAV